MQLGDYTIQTLIGRGGMANVYEALDEKLGRKAAVKVMRVEHNQDDELTQRFVREARAAANLDHPNIVSVYQFGEGPNLYYIAMKLIEGRTLLNILKRLRQQKKYLEPAQVQAIVEQIAAALDYAHTKGVVHRDVKPSNIMLTDDNRAFLTDFGLTMQLGEDSTAGTAFGTPRYIAPEQAIASHKAVPQSDIYSLGVVLYEMATGQPPFDSESPMTLALRHITHQPPAPVTVRPDLPHPVQTVILKALEKRPDNRWPSATAMAEALHAAYEGVEPDVTLTDETLDAPEAMQNGARLTPAASTEQTALMSSQPRVLGSQAGAPAVLGARVPQIPVRLLPMIVIVALLIGMGAIILSRTDSNKPPLIEPFSTPTPLSATRIRLIYTPDWFVVYNASGQPVSLEGITFVRGDQPDRVFDAARFGATTYKNLGAGQCLQIWITTASDHTLPMVCGPKPQGNALSYTDPAIIFWALHGDKDVVGTFLVTRNRTPLQTCSMRVNTCEFSLS
jgi:serine/threonine protein kinase